MHTLYALGELLASSPTPPRPPGILPNVPIPEGVPRLPTVTIGQSGAWVGPLAVGLLAGALDYSAAGAGAIRDRIAVAGYYACTVSMALILGWTGYIRGTVGADYNWRMAGAVASLITHGALLVCWVGRPTAIAKQLSKKIGFNSGASSSAKINQPLLGWTVAAGLTSPLSGDQGWGRVVDAIAAATTGVWAAIVNSVFSWLGG